MLGSASSAQREHVRCSQDRIRAQHREVLRLALRVHPAPRLVEYLALGLGSKSSRTRIEAMEALGEILAAEGLAPFERARDKPFPAIAQVRAGLGQMREAMATIRCAPRPLMTHRLGPGRCACPSDSAGR